MGLLYVSIFAMVLVAALCAAASLWHGYQDNTLQRIGLALLGCGAALRAYMVSVREQISAEEALVHVGVLVFGLGTALKVWSHRPRRRHRKGAA